MSIGVSGQASFDSLAAQVKNVLFFGSQDCNEALGARQSVKGNFITISVHLGGLTEGQIADRSSRASATDSVKHFEIERTDQFLEEFGQILLCAPYSPLGAAKNATKIFCNRVGESIAQNLGVKSFSGFMLPNGFETALVTSCAGVSKNKVSGGLRVSFLDGRPSSIAGVRLSFKQLVAAAEIMSDFCIDYSDPAGVERVRPGFDLLRISFLEQASKTLSSNQFRQLQSLYFSFESELQRVSGQGSVLREQDMLIELGEEIRALQLEVTSAGEKPMPLERAA